MREEPKILIVGAGPTGLTAALELAGQGVPFRIIDQREEPITTSNALAIQPRTLELWKTTGLIDEALAMGHVVQGLSISTERREIGKISLKDLPTDYPFILSLPQAKTERLLTEHLSKFSIVVERGVCLSDFVQEGDAVRTVCNGTEETYDWVIGCDGVHSTVRTLAEIPFEGRDFSQSFIMADLHINWNKPSNFAHAIISTKGPVAFLPFDDEGFGRLIIDVTGDHHFGLGVQPQFADFQRLVDERVGVQAALSDPSWISSFGIQGRVASSYRQGRLFLAGDAAHCHSPLGGQGLNLGIQDAHCLATLLSRCLESGTYDDLDCYEKIRRPIGKQIVRRTSFLTQVMTTRSPLAQSARNFLMHNLLRFPPFGRKVAMTLSQLVYPLKS